jgi:hypothetical protein
VQANGDYCHYANHDEYLTCGGPAYTSIARVSRGAGSPLNSKGACGVCAGVKQLTSAANKLINVAANRKFCVYMDTTHKQHCAPGQPVTSHSRASSLWTETGLCACSAGPPSDDPVNGGGVGAAGPDEASCFADALHRFGDKVLGRRSSMVVGAWGWVPRGCTVQSGGDWAVHYNRYNHGSDDGTYTHVPRASRASAALAPGAFHDAATNTYFRLGADGQTCSYASKSHHDTCASVDKFSTTRLSYVEWRSFGNAGRQCDLCRGSVFRAGSRYYKLTAPDQACSFKNDEHRKTCDSSPLVELATPQYWWVPAPGVSWTGQCEACNGYPVDTRALFKKRCRLYGWQTDKNGDPTKHRNYYHKLDDNWSVLSLLGDVNGDDDMSFNIKCSTGCHYSDRPCGTHPAALEAINDLNNLCVQMGWSDKNRGHIERRDWGCVPQMKGWYEQADHLHLDLGGDVNDDDRFYHTM